MPPAAAPKQVVARKRIRKRKRRAAIFSSSSSSSSDSSDSDSDVQLIPATVPNPNHLSSSSSSSDSEYSDSDSSSSFTASTPPKTLQPKAREIPKDTSSTLRRSSPSPSPPPAEIATFLPSKNAGVVAKNIVQEQAAKDRFRQLWMASVADGFKEDLEDIRKASFLFSQELSKD